MKDLQPLLVLCTIVIVIAAYIVLCSTVALGYIQTVRHIAY